MKKSNSPKKITENKNYSGTKCKKCKKKSLRYEPACRVCMICGWVEYKEKANYDELWHQDILNKQYISATHLTQILCAYRPIEHTLRYLEPATEEELRALTSICQRSQEDAAKFPHAPMWFIKEQLT